MACSLRLGKLVSGVGVVGVLLGLAASPASASTAELIDVPFVEPFCGKYDPNEDCSPRPIPMLAYRAGRGEANRVRIMVTDGKVRIRDLGAAIESGRGCARVGLHHVSCEMPSEGLYVATGGRGDRVKALLGQVPRLIVDGGAGDDVLVGGSGDDLFFGGRGEDVLRGRGGQDVLHDAAPPRMFRAGDPSPFWNEPNRVAKALPLADPGRGRDTFDGGGGGDTVSYEGRSAKVRIDLATRRLVAGARREHDSVRRAEGAIGGAGGDRIAGTRAADQLDGSEGDDRIAARGGDDQIEGGSGRNAIAAGPGNDVIDGTYRPPDLDSERISCGSGNDYVAWVSPNDFVEGCERVELHFLREGSVFGGTVNTLLPLRAGSPPNVLSTTLSCFFHLNPSGCQVKLELVVAGPATRGGTAPRAGTLLGSQVYALRGDSTAVQHRTVTLGLSPTGVARLRRHRALRVNLKATESSVPTNGFQTVLRSP